MFSVVLKWSSQKLAAYLFMPVAVSGILYLLNFKLTAFIIFQIFIETFALWQLSIGLNLAKNSTLKKMFIFNMIFAILYRFLTNCYQAVYFYQMGEFVQIENLLWLIPFHLYATAGVVYCFYLNAKWIISAEEENDNHSTADIYSTFFRLLIFPWGLWKIQPRLNRIILK